MNDCLPCFQYLCSLFLVTVAPRRSSASLTLTAPGCSPSAVDCFCSSSRCSVSSQFLELLIKKPVQHQIQFLYNSIPVPSVQVSARKKFQLKYLIGTWAPSGRHLR